MKGCGSKCFASVPGLFQSRIFRKPLKWSLAPMLSCRIRMPPGFLSRTYQGVTRIARSTAARGTCADTAISHGEKGRPLLGFVIEA